MRSLCLPIATVALLVAGAARAQALSPEAIADAPPSVELKLDTPFAVPATETRSPLDARGTDLAGTATYYANRFQGRRTASGQVFDQNALTAAHRTLPFGTLVRVTHARNERSVVVRINDRGPMHRGRVIDLSRAAARELGMLRSGQAPVRLEIVGDTQDNGSADSAPLPEAPKTTPGGGS